MNMFTNIFRNTATAYSHHHDYNYYQHSAPQYTYWPLPPPTHPPEAPSMMTGLMLRYQANMMKLRAETMAQEGRRLEVQARMREEQETQEAEEAIVLQCPQIQEAEEAIALQSQQIIRKIRNSAVIANSMDGLENPNSDMNKSKITHDMEEKQHSKIEDSVPNTCDNLQVREAVCHQEGTSDYEDEQKVFMKKDLQTLIELVNENKISSISIDPQIFKSSIFKEADKLITVNDHFHSLMRAVGQEMDNQNENEEDDIKTEFEKVKGTNVENMPLNLSKATLEIRDPNLNFSNEEINWVQQLDQNLQKSLKIFVRPEFFRAVINFRLEKIGLKEFSKVMLAGRPARTYCFLMIMSNLPYFKDLTTKYLFNWNQMMKSKLNFHF